MSLPFNPIVPDPKLRDVLKLLIKEVMLSLNCHHVGTIQSFDSSNQTVSVKINYTKTYVKLNPATLEYEQVQEDYPVLENLPIFIYGGGGKRITAPISEGDQCLVAFNDRDLDNWLKGRFNTTGPVNSVRLHSFSDGIAFVGFESLDSYDTERLLMSSDGGAGVGVGDTLVKIYNNTTTLNTLLQGLVSAVTNLVTATAAITVTGVTTGVGVSGVPVNAATITAIASDLSGIASDIAGLLE